jgi:serine/threonine protein kinase
MTEHAALQTARWLRLRTLFDAAFDLPVLARTRLLEQLREEDTLLADELAALLAAADASDDTGVRAADLRARVLGELGVLGATVPEQAGAFTIGDEIGRGGMGVVYRGHRSDGVMDQPVAVKFLHAGALAAAEQDRLLRECRTLSALDHPGVARILDAGRTSDGRAYLAMELVEGKPLIEWCDEHRLGLRAAVELFLKVCAAVEHAHQRWCCTVTSSHRTCWWPTVSPS